MDYQKVAHAEIKNDRERAKLNKIKQLILECEMAEVEAKRIVSVATDRLTDAMAQDESEFGLVSWTAGVYTTSTPYATTGTFIDEAIR